MTTYARRWLGGSVIAISMAGCADYPPTETANPFNIPAGSGDIVSVCYDSGDHSRREIEDVARQLCPYPDSTLEPWQVDSLFNDCPLLKKTRISFRCTAPIGTTLPPRKRRGNVTNSTNEISPRGTRNRLY